MRGARLTAFAMTIAAWQMMTVAWGGDSKPEAKPSRPNIVVLVADDLGYADLGFQGGKDIPTPNLDALAKGGVVCSSGYVSGPYCSPTRAGLLTGRYQQRFGHEFNPGESNSSTFGLPLNQTTIANRLKEAGYATGLVGKWHLGSAPQFRPRQRGFDEFFGFLGGSHTYFVDESLDIYRNDEVVKESAYLTDAISREAVAFIERHKQGPFFLEVAFNAVHTPMDATSERLAKFDSIADKTRRTYAAMLSSLDEAVGAVLGKVRDAGLEKNTLVVFISDNGGPTLLGTTINGSINAPLRGSKRTTLEGGIRVPFVLSWKGKLPEGKVYDKPVIQLDILPTALAAADVETKADWKLDGVNLLPYLEGRNEGSSMPHDVLLWRLGAQAAIRKGDWKLVRYDRAIDTPGVRSVPAKTEVTPFLLYNLSEDIGETHDRSADYPDKARELLAAWQDWDKDLVKPLWGPSNGVSDAAKKKAATNP